ncbi:MAG: fimbrial protein [Bacteroides intestinalis]
MLKIKSILVSLLAVAALASCSDDNDNPGGGDEKNYDAAYMSISLSVPKASRTRAGSTETGALESETKINEIYLILFDKDKKVVKDKDASTYYSILSSSHLSEDGTSVGTIQGLFCYQILACYS